ncbi:MAG: hypothetical protein FJW30_17950, partial [Acidobacteria bacterium]|nr:hypothetical protein [Acidobacteriota bacterium]
MTIYRHSVLCCLSAVWMAGCAAKKPAVAAKEAGPSGATIPAKLDRNAPVYPYSVVPGGTATAEAAKAAVASDPVVAEHYHAVKLGALEEKTLEGPKNAYVSYRVGDKVFWTRKTLLLKAGETVLTDGESMIRGRCGNLVSTTPQEPVAAANMEPREAVFDMPVPAAYLTAALPAVAPPTEIPQTYAEDPGRRDTVLSNLPAQSPADAVTIPNGGQGLSGPAAGLIGGAALGGIGGGLALSGNPPATFLAPEQPLVRDPALPPTPILIGELAPPPAFPPGTHMPPPSNPPPPGPPPVHFPPPIPP